MKKGYIVLLWVFLESFKEVIFSFERISSGSEVKISKTRREAELHMRLRKEKQTEDYLFKNCRYSVLPYSFYLEYKDKKYLNPPPLLLKCKLKKLLK